MTQKSAFTTKDTKSTKVRRKEKDFTAEAWSTRSFGQEILFSRVSRPNNHSLLNCATSVCFVNFVVKEILWL
jgi:hypothetical protein